MEDGGLNLGTTWRTGGNGAAWIGFRRGDAGARVEMKEHTCSAAGFAAAMNPR